MSQKGWFHYLAALVVMFVSIPLITGHHISFSGYVVPNWLVIVCTLLVVYLLLHFRKKKVFPIKIKNNPHKVAILHVTSTALTLLFGFIVFKIIFPGYNSIMWSGITRLGLVQSWGTGPLSLGALIFLVMWFPAYVITYSIFDDTDNSWMLPNLVFSFFVIYTTFFRI